MTKQIEAFEAWWADTGEQSLYALNTTTDDDIKILAGIAWEAAIREALSNHVEQSLTMVADHSGDANEMVAKPVKQEPVAFKFVRYVNGKEMAEGVTIERETTLDAAIKKAVSLCPDRAKTVLVYATPVQPVKQEPVAWHEPNAYGNVTTHKKWAEENGWLPLYTKE